MADKGILSRFRAVAVATALLASAALMLPAAPADEDQSVVKQCVDGRQTQDPSSPPCQAIWTGDNGGETWQGVTEDEITLLLVADAGLSTEGDEAWRPPRSGTYCSVDLMDCDADGQTDDRVHPLLRAANAYMRYFNSRMQTYDRHVRATLYWTASDTPSSRRADAADNWEELTPFAAIDLTRLIGHQEVYAHAMGSRDTMSFGSFRMPGRAFMANSAPQIWSLWPDAENSAWQFASYLCAKVATTRVSQGPHASEPRRFGLYHRAVPSTDGWGSYVNLLKDGLSSCGVTFAAEAIFPFAGSSSESPWSSVSAASALTRFRTELVNTIIWVGGPEPELARLSDLTAYQPEVVAIGDGRIDSSTFAREHGVMWSNAWVVSHRPLTHADADDPAYGAYKEAEPDGEDERWARQIYPELFTFFRAVQQAGPKLDPTTVELGLRALQAQSSTSPYSPATYSETGDWSLVKDAVEAWWDPAGYSGHRLGCYRLVNGGVRYRASEWSTATSSGLGPRTADGSPDGSERVAGRDVCTDLPSRPAHRLL